MVSLKYHFVIFWLWETKIKEMSFNAIAFYTSKYIAHITKPRSLNDSVDFIAIDIQDRIKL